jgi:hypothetical protein
MHVKDSDVMKEQTTVILTENDRFGDGRDNALTWPVPRVRGPRGGGDAVRSTHA